MICSENTIRLLSHGVTENFNGIFNTYDVRELKIYNICLLVNIFLSLHFGIIIISFNNEFKRRKGACIFIFFFLNKNLSFQQRDKKTFIKTYIVWIPESRVFGIPNVTM